MRHSAGRLSLQAAGPMRRETRKGTAHLGASFADPSDKGRFWVDSMTRSPTLNVAGSLCLFACCCCLYLCQEHALTGLPNQLCVLDQHVLSGWGGRRYGWCDEGLWVQGIQEKKWMTRSKIWYPRLRGLPAKI